MQQIRSGREGHAEVDTVRRGVCLTELLLVLPSKYSKGPAVVTVGHNLVTIDES
jgi:hypothetical protein